jgi:dTDP-glucose pyrophosphorylase
MVNRKIIIHENFTIKDTLKKLDEAGEKTLLVVDENDRLLGTITDGDIRRHILKGISIENTIQNLYNKTPISLSQKEYNQELSRRMLIDNKIELLPIIDDNNKVVDYIIWSETFSHDIRKIKKKLPIELPVVIMAGGKGTRMTPFTSILPKPLIPIGEKTILECIITGFQDFGINDFYLTLNYKGEMIKAYFNSIEKDYNIKFFSEKDYLGTAGSLNLVKNHVKDTFIVSNCDIIVKANYEDVLNFHMENNSELTILSSIQHYRIPYGVITFKEGGEVTHVIEKPEYTFTINTGVYILNKSCLKYIPHNTFFHITDLIHALLENNKEVLTYPVNENDYIDVGQWKEYKEAVEKLS